MPLAAGEKVDRYTILEPIGHGGMGEVYRAHDERLQRTVALKILRPAATDASGASSPMSAPMSTDGAARMVREARAAAALDHPNVVAIFDVGEVNDAATGKSTTYLAMELIKGKPLRAYIGDTTVPMKLRVRWLTDVARALGAAHKAGLVHRDIKPENVMIRDDGVVKVLDFGIAKRAHVPVDPKAATAQTSGLLPTLTTEGIVIGTPYYMSPEQLRNEKLDGRSDQFSWGVLAYEVMCGVPPWTLGAQAVNLIAEVLSRDVDPPSQREASVPPNVDATILRALEKSRNERFATMEDVIEALEGHVDALAPTERHESARDLVVPAETRATTGATTRPSQQPPAMKRRRPTWLFAVVVAVGAAAGALAIVRSRAPATPTVPSATPRECATSKECVDKAGGKAARCTPQGRCAALASEDCVVLASDRAITSDRTVWIGSLFPRTGPRGEAFGLTNERAVDLARREFDQVMAGLVERGEARPIGLVACDDNDPLRAVRHLVDDAGVPAIIGFRSGETLRDVVATTLAPRGVVALVTLSTDSLATRVPMPEGSPRLVWRVTQSDAALADAAAAFVESRLEARLRSSSPSLARSPIRVAYVRPTALAGSAISQVLLERLRFNGKSALENGRDYGDFVVAPDASSVDSVAALRRFAPHIVLYTTSRVGQAAMNALEQGEFKPIYVTVGGPDVELVTSTKLNGRLYGVVPIGAQIANARFTSQFNATFPDHPMSRELSTSESYDAFYILLYAAIAAGDQATDGRELARRFERVVGSGRKVTVGTAQMFEAFQALAHGGQIDLEGATGTLDFELSSGEVLHDLSLMCATRDAADGAVRAEESGVVLRARDRRVEGTLRCP